jgi:hypothetical protein
MSEHRQFEITKASDFNDEEIHKFWVEFSKEFKFDQLMKITSATPMIIMGAKGSGKTHLMRYFSFALQKIRYGSSHLINGIIKNDYLGIYIPFTGLNPGRFAEKGISKDTWSIIFSYYFELWVAQILIKNLLEIKNEASNLFKSETQLSHEIINLFDKWPAVLVDDFTNLQIQFTNFQKSLDYAINTSAVTGNLEEVEILVTPGKLIFGIPKILASNINEFSNVRFVYLFDEFENINESQQMHINTLVRDRQNPCNIKIGVRLYGIKTYKTNNGDEENKEGSEFERIKLDSELRVKNYKDFFAKMCEKRLQTNEYESIDGMTKDELYIYNCFEELDEEFILNKIKKKYDTTEKPYFKKLKQNLKSVYSDKEFDKIIGILKYDESPLLERTNIFLFYREIKKGKYNAIESAEFVKAELEKYLKGNLATSKHSSILEKFKSDISAQLFNECGEDVVYAGFNTLLDMSHGIPRVLITILREITKQSSFMAENPFEKNSKISLKAQMLGIKDAGDWFWEEARLPGQEGEIVKNSITRLARFLREIRYSALPPECSLTAFIFDPTKISSESNRIISLCEQYSYLIKEGDRKDKNSKNILPIYQLNRILAPRWELPIYKRGELNLSVEEIESIFSKDGSNYEKLLKIRLSKYNFPFNKIFDKSVQTLFDKHD